MFEQLFKAARARERHRNAPLLDERIRYLTHWAAQGSIRSSLRVRAQDLLTTIEYLDLEALMSNTVPLMRSPFTTSTRLSLAKASMMLTPAHRQERTPTLCELSSITPSNVAGVLENGIEAMIWKE